MPAEIPTLSEIEALMRRVVREELGQRATPDVLSTGQAAEVAGARTGPRVPLRGREEGRGMEG